MERTMDTLTLDPLPSRERGIDVLPPLGGGSKREGIEGNMPNLINQATTRI
jgi:hypothetical protein